MGTLSERLWSKIDRHGPDECWPWVAGADKDGYGVISVDNKQRRAHVLVLECSTGEQANGRFALHSCDNPPCCNPGHLRWGTSADNQNDCARRKRRSGEVNGASKLTSENVDQIRARYVKGSKDHGLAALAKQFTVGTSTIYDVVCGRTWER